MSDRVAEEVRAQLARKRITGRELARRLNVSHSWVNYRLTGTQEIGLNDLERIAAALGVDVAELLPLGPRSQTTGRSFAPAERPRDNRPKGRASSGESTAGIRRPRRIANPALTSVLTLAA